jgi:hypothetical protein
MKCRQFLHFHIFDLAFFTLQKNVIIFAAALISPTSSKTTLQSFSLLELVVGCEHEAGLTSNGDTFTE